MFSSYAHIAKRRMSAAGPKLGLRTLAMLLAMSLAAGAHAQVGTAFTYQGQLKQSGSPVNGSVDLQFRLFDAAASGNQIGSTLAANAVAVSGGVFTSSLDFGALAFNGDERWLEIAVASPANGGIGPFVTLTPRQRITAAPYALYALNSSSPFGFDNGNAVFTSGSVGIGTSTPTAALHVLGTAPGATTARIENPLPASSANLVLASAADSGSSAGVLFQRGGSAAASIIAQDNLNFSVNSVAAMSILPNGTVGIGPGPFATDADLQIGIDPVLNTSFGGSNLQIGSASSSQLILGRPDADYMQMSTSFFGNRLGAVGINGLQLQTGADAFSSTPRLSITPAGSVGIGTTTPTATLDVAGSFKADDTTLVVDAANNRVGIGVATPTADLHIRGAGSLGSLLITPTTADSISQVVLSENSSNSFGMIMRMDGAANRLDFLATQSGIEQLPVLSIARSSAPAIGIGTTSPQDLLHVSGGLSGVTSNSSSRVIFEDDTSHFLNILAPDGVQTGILFGKPTGGPNIAGLLFNTVNAPDGLEFRTGGNVVRAIISSTGNMGVGTVSPAEKLHVNGNARVEGNLVLNGDIDYVSPPSRSLMVQAGEFVSVGGETRVWRGLGAVSVPFTYIAPVSSSVGVYHAIAPVTLPHGSVVQSLTIYGRHANTNSTITVKMIACNPVQDPTAVAGVQSSLTINPTLPGGHFTTSLSTSMIVDETVSAFIDIEFAQNVLTGASDMSQIKAVRVNYLEGAFN